VELARQYQRAWKWEYWFWILVLIAGVVVTAISAAYIVSAVWADGEFPVRWMVIGATAVFLTVLSAARRRAHARERAIRTVERALIPFLMQGAAIDGAPDAVSRAIVEGLTQLDRY